MKAISLSEQQNEPVRHFDRIAKKLIEDYPEQEYKAQLTIRTFIMHFVRSLSLEAIRGFYDLLINSERKIDRRRAGEIADLIWCDEVEGKLWDNYHKYKDEESLIPLVNCLTPIDLSQLMEKCWTIEFPSYRLKNTIIKKIVSAPIENMIFLKDIEPAYYIQAMAVKKEKVDKKTIRNLIKSMTGENKIYLVWYLGMTGDWDLVAKYLDK